MKEKFQEKIQFDSNKSIMKSRKQWEWEKLILKYEKEKKLVRFRKNHQNKPNKMSLGEFIEKFNGKKIRKKNK